MVLTPTITGHPIANNAATRGKNDNTNSLTTNVTASGNNNLFAGKPTYVSYNNNIPPAYLTWKKPVPNQTFPPLFKIGVSNITFEWTVNSEMLKVHPENLTVALANPQKQTYTAAIVSGAATSANWNLADIPSNSPLMMGYYTVWVYDQRGPKAFPSPGWLMPDSRLVLAMYNTEAYVGRTDSKFFYNFLPRKKKFICSLCIHICMIMHISTKAFEHYILIPSFAVFPKKKIAMFCPTCYLGADASSLRESLLPWGITFLIALCTSGIMMFFMIY